MKPILMGSTALVALSLLASHAQAACAPTQTPANNTAATCTGPITGVVGGNAEISVVLTLTGATLTNPGTADNIQVLEASTVNLQDTNVNTAANYFGIKAGGAYNQVHLSGTSTVSGAGGGIHGGTLGHDNTISLSDTSSIDAAGGNDAISFAGYKNHISLSDSAHIHTATNTSNGVYVQGNQNSITLTGNGYIHADNATGIKALGDSNTISLNGTVAGVGNAADIQSGNNANTVYVKGNSNQIYLSNNLNLHKSGTGSTIVITGTNNMVTLNGTTGQTNVYSTAVGSAVVALGNTGTDANNTLKMYGDSRIHADGNSQALSENGTLATLSLHNGAQISTTDATNQNDVVLSVAQTNNVTLYDTSKISGAGIGLHLIGTGNNNVTLNGAAEIDAGKTGISSGKGSISMNGGYIKAGGTGILTSAQTVTLNNGAHIKADGDHGVALYTTGAVLSLDHNSHIDATADLAQGVSANYGQTHLSVSNGSMIKTTGYTSDAVMLAGGSNVVTLNGGHIETDNIKSDAVSITGNGNMVSLSNGGDIKTLGFDPNGHFGSNAISMTGSDNVVTLDSHSYIETVSARAFGIYVDGAGTHISMHDSNINATAVLSQAIRLNHADNAQIVLSGTSKITTAKHGAYGIAMYNADHATIQLQDDSSIVTNQGHGIDVELSTNTTINLLGNTMVSANFNGTGGYYNDGIEFDSTGTINIGSNAEVKANQIGVFLGVGGATLNNYGSIVSSGANAASSYGVTGSGNADTVVNGGTISGLTKGIYLGAGDDHLTLKTGSHIIGGIDGGADNDTITLNGVGSQSGSIVNFETLDQAGGRFALSGDSSFDDIKVTGGELLADGHLATTNLTHVYAGGTLSGTGTMVGDVNSVGTIAAGDDAVGTLTVNGDFTQTGGAFNVRIGSAGASEVIVHGANGAQLNNGPTLKVLQSGGGSSGTAKIILHADNGVTGSFGTVQFVGNGAATVAQTANDVMLTALSGTPIVAQDFAANEAGLDFIDSIGDEQIAALDTCQAGSCADENDHQKHLWAKAFGHFGNEAPRDGDAGFDYTIAGTAFGGDMKVAKDLRLGVAAGYSNTDQNVDDHAAANDIDTGQLALYANWQHGPFFITGLLSGGWQGFDLSRQVDDGGSGSEADAKTHGWLFGTSIQAGAQFAFPKGWRLTPSAGLAYQHSWQDGYNEHGAGLSDVAVKSHQSDALRLHAQLELANDIALGDVVVTPSLTIGAQQQIHLGGAAEGQFFNGDDFAINLKNETRTAGLIGLGTTVSFANGLSTYVKYNATLASDTIIHAVTGGLRYSW